MQTYRTNRLHGAILLALGAGTCLAALPASAIAQDGQATATTTNKQPTDLDGVRVTGSRLRQVDVETAQPITLIDRAQIEKQGFQTVGDILQNDPAMGTPPNTRATANAGGTGDVGGNYASLRRLGPQRSLVLVNGQRMGTSVQGFADLSLIPAAAVERIEILKDGASSIYGSDAIAGVINIITRTDFDGAIVDTYLGQYGQGDGTIKKGSFVFGHTGERYALTVGAEASNEDAVLASDREFSAYPRSYLHPTDNWAANIGGFTTTATNRVPGLPNGTRVVLRPGGNPRNINDYIRQDMNTGSCLPSAGATIDGCVPGSTLHKINGRDGFTLRMPMATRSVFADFKFDLTDSIAWRTNLLYSTRNGVATLGGTPGPPTNWEPTRPGMSANSYFNPTGATLTTWTRQTSEIPRQWDRTLTTRRLSSIVSGTASWGSRHVDWDVGALYTRSENEQIGYGHLNTINLQRAVGPSFLNGQGQVQCGTAAAPIAFSECVPFNPFLPMGVEGPGGLTNNRELQDYLFQPFTNSGRTETKDFVANVATTLFSLPGGEIGIAAGVERRVETGDFIPALVSTLGQVSALSAGPTRGSYSLNEAYVEMELPILSGLPFAKELSFSLATRFSDYNTFGETTNSKFGLRWRPNDTLLVRATVADGFRAPTIADLHGGGSTTFPQYSDPCDTVFGSAATNATTRANCARDLGALAPTFRQLGANLQPVGQATAATGVPFLGTSNPDLLPETAKSQTIGVVWSPKFIEGFSVTVDWWKIRIENTIVDDSPNNILNDCYVLGITSRCQPTAGTSFTRDPARGYISQLTFSSTNAGFRKVEGYDVNLRYRLPATRIGNFVASLNTAYLAKNYNLSSNTPRRALSNVGEDANFRVRALANLNWEYGNFGASWSTRYYSGLSEPCTYFITTIMEPHLECNDIGYRPTGNLPGQGVESALSRLNHTGSNAFHDVQVRWKTSWDASIALGANNVFAHYGPVMYSAPGSTFAYYGGFDIGRFIYMKYTQKF
ncbi:MAG: TonB-dependent receptor [Proteobacteria bacterium]|nr:TonB-dependent receptor [Pseudomonadota bacterium]